MVDLLGEIIAPAQCQLCREPTHRAALCKACITALPWNRPCCPRCALPQLHEALCADCAAQTPPYDQAWCPLRMETPVESAIYGLKYRAGFLHAHSLGTLMTTALVRRAAPLPQMLIPVPLHPLRLLRRGYNQALELGRAIAAHTDIKLAPQAARRLRHTPDQIGKTAAQRRRNIQGAFRIEQDLQGQHLALLDDVMTTGATLSELARACRKAGAARIEVWALARVA